MANAARVSETVTVTGSGTVTLSGNAVAAYQTWYSGFGSGGSTNAGYCIVDNTTNAWETGIGNFNGGNPGTLTRGFINSSTNAAVSFAGNSCTVSCDFVTDVSGNLTATAMPIGSGGSSLIPQSPQVRALGIITGQTAGTLGVSANRQLLWPFQVSAPTLVSNLGVIVTTAAASSTFSVGIYADNNNSGGAGNLASGSPLVAASGQSGATVAVVTASVGTPYLLTPGVWYWGSFIPSSSSIVIRGTGPGSVAVPLGFTSAGAAIYGNYLTSTGSTLLAPVSGTPTVFGTNQPLLVFS